MKAPREHRPQTPAATNPQRQPSGPAQRRVDDSARQRQTDARNGGLPTQLRSGLESLSGLDMSDVRVHRNSSKPAQLEAAAYAQGRDIHLAPGQDHHLPHEAWHVVQQRQGRVRATTDVAGVPVNDHPALEREADVMGGQAVQRVSVAQFGKNKKKERKKSKHSDNDAQGYEDHPDARQIDGIAVIFSPGYASWVQGGDSWHINWRLGEGSVYHVTLEASPHIHYYFTLNSGDITDAVAPKGMKGRKGTSNKFSALPGDVQRFVTDNIDSLVT